MKVDNYLILDEQRNAMDSIIQSLTFLSQVEQNRFYLKWFILAFHGAIYAFMLLALQKIDPEQIYRAPPKHTSKKTSKAKSFDPFDRKLIDFLVAYRYLKNSKRMGGNSFSASKLHNEAMKELNNKLRNQMIHFKPMVWASEPWYPANVCKPLLVLLEFCIRDTKLSEEQKKTAFAYIESIKTLLTRHSD